MTFGCKCKYCGCTDERACDINGEPCMWIMRDICSNPECFRKCTDKEKKDWISIMKEGTYFDMISRKSQEKVMRELGENVAPSV